jgi:cation transport ATPase
VATGGTVGFIATDNVGMVGVFCVKDAFREEARAGAKWLKYAQIDIMICTRDSNSIAHAIAKEIGMP